MEKSKLSINKKNRILYFLWLDDQIMHYWSIYVDLKFPPEETITIDKETQKKIDSCLSTIDYFENHQRAIKQGITYQEIDHFVQENPSLCCEYLFFRFMHLTKTP